MTRHIVDRFDEPVEVRVPAGAESWASVPATLLAHAVDDADGEWWARVQVDEAGPNGVEVPEWVPVWWVFGGELTDDDGVVSPHNVVELHRGRARGVAGS